MFKLMSQSKIPDNSAGTSSLKFAQTSNSDPVLFLGFFYSLTLVEADGMLAV